MKSPILSFLLVLFTSTFAQVQAQSVQLELALDDPQPLSQDVYGANNECIFRPVWFDHPAYAEKYIAAGRPFLRFPGGTGSNFYNPATGFFDEDSPSTRDYTGHNQKIAKFTDGAGRTPDEYLKFAKKYEVPYSLVLNVCTQSFEQNKTWLEKIASEGHAISRIEIGNEVFYGGYKWAFPTATDYLERAKKLTAVIREALPETKVGVVIPTHLYQYDNFVTADRPAGMNHQHEWMTVLEGETFFDAVVMHVYSLTGMSNMVKPADFMSHLEAYQNCDAHLNRSLDNTLDTLEAKFPGKSIWMTEFGVGGFGGNLKQYTLRYSHLGALHADVMLLRFIKRPSVNVAHWHSFQHFFDFVGGRKGIGDKEHLAYTHFSLFAQAVRNSEAVVPAKANASNDNSETTDDIEAAAFIGPGKGYVMLVNKHASEFSINGLTAVSSGKTIKPRISEAVQLVHRTDMPIARAMQDVERCERVELTASQMDSLTLPPYSITRLDFTPP